MVKIEFDEEKHEYRVGGVKYPSVTEIIRPISAVFGGGAPETVIQTAAARGSMVHEALEEYDLCGSAEYFAEIEGYVKAYLKFLRDYAPEWEGVEEKVYNPLDGVCGTLDRRGVIGKQTYIIDLKTNTAPSAPQYFSVCAQTWAYARAKYGAGAGGVRRAAVYLKSNGEYRFFECEKYEKKQNVSGKELYEICLALYKMTRRTK